MAPDRPWYEASSISDYSHHNEMAPIMWAAEQSPYDSEPSDDPYDDYDRWDDYDYEDEDEDEEEDPDAWREDHDSRDQIPGMQPRSTIGRGAIHWR